VEITVKNIMILKCAPSVVLALQGPARSGSKHAKPLASANKPLLATSRFSHSPSPSIPLHKPANLATAPPKAPWSAPLPTPQLSDLLTSSRQHAAQTPQQSSLARPTPPFQSHPSPMQASQELRQWRRDMQEQSEQQDQQRQRPQRLLLEQRQQRHNASSLPSVGSYASASGANWTGPASDARCREQERGVVGSGSMGQQEGSSRDTGGRGSSSGTGGQGGAKSKDWESTGLMKQAAGSPLKKARTDKEPEWMQLPQPGSVVTVDVHAKLLQTGEEVRESLVLCRSLRTHNAGLHEAQPELLVVLALVERTTHFAFPLVAVCTGGFTASLHLLGHTCPPGSEA
jgi:hypothetical protein